MIDIRYHIYSLAAVFFALAVGIVVGTAFAGRTPATEGARRTIQRYENSMRTLKREIELASEDAAKKEAFAKDSEDFCRAVLPIVAKDRLAWRNVAIVQTGDYDDLSGYVKRVLELAGAHVTSTTDINRTFPFDDHEKVAEVLINCGETPPPNAKEARDRLFSIIADTLYAAKYSTLLSKLEEAGVGKFTGDYGKYNKLIVLVGGSESADTNTSDTIDGQLVARLERPDVIVVGCEGTQAVESYVPSWHKMGIATVDNADSALGQIALVCALNCENAQFGVKDTADRLIPQTLEKK
ncbi:MAG: copper transporter [Armatimonadetes bacterium]|nr:copper transporter [Armatimonadota bacterium]